jgi:uncharacterized protein (TIGR03083 family)
MREEREALTSLLASLTPEEWGAHAIGVWNVHDVALHLLGNDLGRLGPSGFSGGRDDLDYATLAKLIEDDNDRWVEATRRISPVLLPELLSLTGSRLDRRLATVDMHAPGVPVAWTGTGPSPAWLDVAREYTERWVHHQQIRDAVEREALMDPKWAHPAFETFSLALPRAYDDVAASEGTQIRVAVTGPAGGSWFLRRDEDRWRIVDAAEHAAAQVDIPQEIAWRLFVRLMPPEEALSSITRHGSGELTSPACSNVAIMTTHA